MTAAAQPRPQYAALVDAVVAKGGRVWIETDLLKAWLEGPERYDSVLSTVLSLADRAGVDGIKIADELGYRDGASPEEVRDFLARDHLGHSRAACPGTRCSSTSSCRELGCLRVGARRHRRTSSRDACAEAARSKNPASTLAAVDGYIAAGWPGRHRPESGAAQPEQVRSLGHLRDAGDGHGLVRGRPSMGRQGAGCRLGRRWRRRTAMREPRPTRPPMSTRSSTSRSQHGAKSVDIWTWRQPYKGGSYMLTNPGLVPNALVEELRKRRARGADLWTHMTPSSLHVGLAPDVEAATALFSTIFVASGTG